MKLNVPIKIALLTFVIAGICVLSIAWLSILYTRHLLHEQALQNLSNDMQHNSVLRKIATNTARCDVISRNPRCKMDGTRYPS
jgi:hypothetical protein